MSIPKARIIELLIKHLRDELSETESLELKNWVAESNHNRETLEYFMTSESFRNTMRSVNSSHKRGLQRIREHISASAEIDEGMLTRRRKILVYKFVTAASIIAVVAVMVLYLWTTKERKPAAVAGNAKQEQRFKNDIPAPSGSKTLLTLGDGSKIVLDEAKNGNLTSQGNIQVVKKNGLLTYVTTKNIVSSEVLYNTLETKKGGFFRLSLPDGSQVFLNAASSITYPTAFTGKERKVTVKGEAYFEVSKDPSMKFVVEANGVVTEVLGTRFNVNAYRDNGLASVTLLEGAIRVGNDEHSAMLQPGQQAQLGKNEEIKITRQADIEQVMAWKNGVFRMRGTDIQAIMKEVERWYDVEIMFESKISQTFTGTISRKEPVSKLLKLLEMTDAVRFTIDGRKITVMK